MGVTALIFLALLAGSCSAAPRPTHETMHWATSCELGWNCTRTAIAELHGETLIDELLPDLWSEHAQAWIAPRCASAFVCASEFPGCGALIRSYLVAPCETAPDSVQPVHAHIVPDWRSAFSSDALADILLSIDAGIAVKIVAERDQMHRLLVSVDDLSHARDEVGALLGTSSPHFSLGLRIAY